MSVVFLRGNCLLKDEDYDYDDEGEPLLREGEGLADEVKPTLFIISVVILTIIRWSSPWPRTERLICSMTETPGRGKVLPKDNLSICDTQDPVLRLSTIFLAAKIVFPLL